MMQEKSQDKNKEKTQEESITQEEPEKSEKSDNSPITLIEAKENVIETAKKILEHEFENVIKLEPKDNNWRAEIEVLERDAVPDTQDIIGRYEILLDKKGQLKEYRLLERYNRGEMKQEL